MRSDRLVISQEKEENADSITDERCHRTSLEYYSYEDIEDIFV